MGVYEYQGEPGMGYLYLATAAGTAPHTGLKPGDLVDFGENEPPADDRWAEREGASATRGPDNAQPVPEPDPQDAAPEDAKPADETAGNDPAPSEPAPADPPKRKTAAAKTTAA